MTKRLTFQRPERECDRCGHRVDQLAVVTTRGRFCSVECYEDG